MSRTIQLGDVSIEIVFKDIKNVHLSVNPPMGRVSIAAPRNTKPETLRVFAISKLGWIRSQRAKFQSQARIPKREFVERESHFVWGKRYLLKIKEQDTPPTVALAHKVLRLTVRPGASAEKRQQVMDAWYRAELRAAAEPFIEVWAARLSVKCQALHVQRMKTKWGSSVPERCSIRLNTELAKHARDCLEYVIVHELAHFMSRRHDDKFVALLDRHIPNWRIVRERLNAAPISDH